MSRRGVLQRRLTWHFSLITTVNQTNEPNKSARGWRLRRLPCVGCVVWIKIVSFAPGPFVRGRRVFRGTGSQVRGGAGGIRAMSIDKSLKKGGGLTRTRNVLTRPERLALLQEDERWTPAQGVFNLPKTKFRRLAPGNRVPKRPS